MQFGTIYKDECQLKETLHSFRSAVSFEPTVTYPYIYLATSLSIINQLDEAEKILKLALMKEGDIDEVNYNLSTIYSRKGNFNKAIEYMKECLRIDTNYNNAQKWLDDFINMSKEGNA